MGMKMSVKNLDVCAVKVGNPSFISSLLIINK